MAITEHVQIPPVFEDFSPNIINAGTLVKYLTKNNVLLAGSSFWKLILDFYLMIQRLWSFELDPPPILVPGSIVTPVASTQLFFCRNRQKSSNYCRSSKFERAAKSPTVSFMSSWLFLTFAKVETIQNSFYSTASMSEMLVDSTSIGDYWAHFSIISVPEFHFIKQCKIWLIKVGV